MSSGLQSFDGAQTAGVARALSSDVWSLAEVLGPSGPMKAFLLCSKTFRSGTAATHAYKREPTSPKFARVEIEPSLKAAITLMQRTARKEPASQKFYRTDSVKVQLRRNPAYLS